MSMLKCKECNESISDNAKKCPHCGAGKRQAVGLTKSDKFGKGTAAVLTALIGVVLLAMVHTGSQISEAAVKLEQFGMLLIVIGIVILSWTVSAKTYDPEEDKINED